MGSPLRMRIRASPPGPNGRHRAGSVGPKITTPGAPTAAARCDTPESLPTNADASRAIAATVGKSRSFRTGTPASRKIGSIEVSAGPRMNRHEPRSSFRPASLSFRAESAERRIPIFWQPRRQRRELIRRPVLTGTSAARKNHNQIRAVASRFRQHPRCRRKVLRRRFEARIHRRSGRAYRAANSRPRHGRRRPGGTDETKPRHRSPPPIARETEHRPKRRTSRHDRNRQKTGARRPTSHQRTTPRPRAHRSNARARRRSSPPQAAPARIAPSVQQMRQDAAAKSPPAPASGTSDRPAHREK